MFSTPQRKRLTPQNSSTPRRTHQIHPSPGHTVTKRVKVVKEERPSSPPPSSPPSPPPQPHWDDDNAMREWDGVMADDSSHDNQLEAAAKEEERDPEKPDVCVHSHVFPLLCPPPPSLSCVPLPPRSLLYPPPPSLSCVPPPPLSSFVSAPLSLVSPSPPLSCVRPSLSCVPLVPAQRQLCQ